MLTDFFTTIRGKHLGMVMAVFCLWASVSVAQAGTVLWYNGDYNDATPVLGNELVTPSSISAVYDNFIVPAGQNQNWSITALFSNDFLTTTVTDAHWEIRSGVSSGNGGTVLYSGLSAATQTAVVGTPGLYTVEVSGLTGIVLAPGTYWLTVEPVTAAGTSLIAPTSGANAIGMPPGNDGNSYLYSTIPGFSNYFVPASSIPNVGSPADFSMGIGGIPVAAVPEASTLVMGVISTLTVVGAAWCSRRLGAPAGM